MQMTHNCIFYTPQTFSSCPFLTSCLQATLTIIKVTLSSLVQRITYTKSTDHTHLLSSSFAGSQFFSVLNTRIYFSKLSVILHKPVFPGLLPPHTLSVLSAQLQLFSELLTSGRTPWTPEPSAVLHLIFGVYYHYTFVSLTLCHSHISHKLYVLHSYYSWILNVFNVVLVDLGCKVTLSCYYYYY